MNRVFDISKRQILCFVTIVSSGLIFFILSEKIISDIYYQRFLSYKRLDFFIIGLPLFLSSFFKLIGAFKILIFKSKNTIYFIGSFFTYFLAFGIIVEEFLVPKYDCVSLGFQKEIVIIFLILLVLNTIFLVLYKKISC